jgi:hypothetical protein
MSLPACQRRALAVIEGELQIAEPRMTAMFAIFTRLTGAEDSPGNESLGSQPECPCRRIKLTLGCSGRCAGTRQSRWLRRWQRERRALLHLAALIPLVLTIAVSAVMLGLSRPVRQGCQAAPAMRSWTAILARSSGCPPSNPPTGPADHHPPAKPRGRN